MVNESYNQIRSAFIHAKKEPSVTLNMLIDFLREYQILSCPTLAHREFTSITPLFKKNLHVLQDIMEGTDTLFVCRSTNAEQVLRRHPRIFLLALTRDASIPDWIHGYSERILLIKSDINFSYFSFLVQKYFIKIMSWENEMDRVVLSEGPVNEFLNIASSFLENFLSINDSFFNLLAYTDSVDPPDPVSKYLIEEGFLPEPFIETWKARRQATRLMIEQPMQEIPFVQMHHPIFINQSYFATLVMVCNNIEHTKGLEDIFLKILKRAVIVCENYWKRKTHSDYPYSAFFTRLIRGEKVSRDHLRTQASLAGIPSPAEFKLITLETRGIEKAQLLEKATRAAVSLNNMQNCRFPYEGNFHILYYSPPSDSNLSHAKSLAELNELIYKPYGIHCGISQIFERLEELKLACKQTRIALNMKSIIKSELFFSSEEQDKGVFLFDEALLFYLVGNQEHDKQFLSFTFDHSIVGKLYSEDRKNGTNYVALFWFYLRYERNASLVASRLHIHRNTVIYHIDKIQKRFDFDLSIQSAVERMRIDFKVFFLQMGDETLENILNGSRTNAFTDTLS